MAQQKKPIAQVKLELDAGNAAMVDLGKMLGPHGVATMEVKKRYDAETARFRGEVIPAIVRVYEDRSWDLELRTPPTAFLIKQLVRGKGSARPGHDQPLTIEPAGARGARRDGIRSCHRAPVCSAHDDARRGACSCGV